MGVLRHPHRVLRASCSFESFFDILIKMWYTFFKGSVRIIMAKQKRIQITISDENLFCLEFIYSKYGINKSTQIQSLIAKYLETEYGKIEEKGGDDESK